MNCHYYCTCDFICDYLFLNITNKYVFKMQSLKRDFYSLKGRISQNLFIGYLCSSYFVKYTCDETFLLYLTNSYIQTAPHIFNF